MHALCSKEYTVWCLFIFKLWVIFIVNDSVLFCRRRYFVGTKIFRWRQYFVDAKFFQFRQLFCGSQIFPILLCVRYDSDYLMFSSEGVAQEQYCIIEFQV
jgi:hypothetical protein